MSCEPSKPCTAIFEIRENFRCQSCAEAVVEEIKGGRIAVVQSKVGSCCCSGRVLTMWREKVIGVYGSGLNSRHDRACRRRKCICQRNRCISSSQQGKFCWSKTPDFCCSRLRKGAAGVPDEITLNSSSPLSRTCKPQKISVGYLSAERHLPQAFASQMQLNHQPLSIGFQ